MCRIAHQAILVVVVLLCRGSDARSGVPGFGPEQVIQAGGQEIQVGGYSVPSLTDWDRDGKPDLIVGEGKSDIQCDVRVYLGPQPFLPWPMYVDQAGTVITFEGDEAFGCYPRLADWNLDNRPDLIVGKADGTIALFYDNTDDSRPDFNGYLPLRAYELNCGCHLPIWVGGHATIDVVDWNDDGLQDLISGSGGDEYGLMDGQIRVFINCGTPRWPNLREIQPAADPLGRPVVVPSGSSSPVVYDLDGDGLRDIITGNLTGQVLFYKNIGVRGVPMFAPTPVALESNGGPIALAGSSTPSICLWPDKDGGTRADAYPDLLVGSSDGRVHLFRGLAPGDVNADAGVDFKDFALLGAMFGRTADIRQDPNDNGRVYWPDIQVLAEHWLD